MTMTVVLQSYLKCIYIFKEHVSLYQNIILFLTSIELTLKLYFPIWFGNKFTVKNANFYFFKMIKWIKIDFYLNNFQDS